MQHVFSKKILGFLTLSTLVWAACSKSDDSPAPGPAPTVTIASSYDSNRLVKAGSNLSIALSISAPNGLKQVILQQNGAPVAAPLVTTDTNLVYSLTVPANAEEGIAYYEFVAVDQLDNRSPVFRLPVKATRYDAITIGGQSLLNLAVTDGLVSSGKITLFRDRNYYLPQSLSFAANTELQAMEGVNVYIKAGESVTISMEAGSIANISGTAQKPVVLTSERTLTNNAAPGDWYRLRINGDDADASNQGIIRYLRTEYAEEGLRVDRVGSGTTIDYVQSFRNSAEAFYVVYGNASLKHLIATNSGEDSYRFGETYRGRAQFLIALTTERAPDIDEFTIRESSSATVSNITLVGPGATYTNVIQGVRLRANSSGKIYNAIVAEYPRRGVRTTDAVTVGNLEGPTVFAHSYVFNVNADPYRDGAAAFAGTFDGTTGARLTNPFFNNATQRIGSAYTLTPVAGISVGNFVPSTPAASAFNPSTLGSFFQATDYAGAVKDAAGDWTRGWTRNPDGSIRN